MIFAGVLRVKAYLCCFTQFTIDQSKLTVNGSVLSDTPNVRYLVALYQCKKTCDSPPRFTSRVENSVTPDHLALEKPAEFSKGST